MKCSPEEVINYSKKALNLSANLTLSPQDQEWVKKETLTAFKDNIESNFCSAINNYNSPGSAIIEWKTHESSFIDIQGRRYLDCMGASSANNPGHLHPRIISSVKQQLEQQTAHCLKLLPPLQAMLARMIAMITPGKLQYSFFCESSKDALLGAVEMALRTSNRIILTTSYDNFLKTLKPQLQISKIQHHCNCLPGPFPDILAVPFGDLSALKNAFKLPDRDGKIPGAFILEPICYEEGIIVPSKEYINEVYELCLQNETLFVIDETKIGLARTGKLFAFEHYDVEPDILCLGNTLGGGVMPMGAFIASAGTVGKDKNCPAFNRITYLHSPLCCAAAIATIQVILDEGLVEKAAEKGAYILPYLEKMVRKYPVLKEVRGKGLLIGLEFKKEESAQKVATNLFDRGILAALSSKKPSILLIEPPLSVNLADIDFLLETLELLIKKT